MDDKGRLTREEMRFQRFQLFNLGKTRSTDGPLFRGNIELTRFPGSRRH